MGIDPVTHQPLQPQQAAPAPPPPSLQQQKHEEPPSPPQQHQEPKSETQEDPPLTQPHDTPVEASSVSTAPSSAASGLFGMDAGWGGGLFPGWGDGGMGLDPFDEYPGVGFDQGDDWM
jgi:transcription factor MYB, plant